MSLAEIGGDARLYLKPAGLLDSPQFYDEQNRRLAGGMLWFSQVELCAVEGGRVSHRALIPVEQFDEVIAELPEHHHSRAQTLLANITRTHAPLTCGERTLRFDQPQVMGILNMTPDSFSDGGKWGGDPERAADAGFAMSTAGASIIDIGGESTKPGATEVWEGDEIKRVVPVIERLRQSGAVLSVDTRKAAVMEAAIAAGAQVINDISALLHDPRSLEVVQASGLPVILMHAPSAGKDPHAGPGYGQVVFDIFDWLEARIAEVVAAGIDRSRIIADIGIGFGKSLSDNLALINTIALFHGLGQPMVLGVSRKRIVGALAGEAPADKRLGGSMMLAVRAMEQGVQILRVHDVPEMVQAVQVWRGLRDAGVTARV